MKKFYLRLLSVILSIAVLATSWTPAAARHANVNAVPFANSATTGTLGSVTSTSAVITGSTYTISSGTPVYGVVYSTSSSFPGGSTVYKPSSDPSSPFNTTLMSLTPGTQYWCMAYVTTDGGATYAYGSVVTFTATSNSGTTGTAGSITQTSAIISGSTYSASGGTPVYGVEYSTNSGFTAGPTYVPASGGSPFNTTLSSLTPGINYWFRAYVTTDGGTTYAYGTASQFTTLNAITAQNIAGNSYCTGSVFNYTYTAQGTFTGTFTAQLSDNTGSFASPTTIGSSNTETGGITVTIPAVAAGAAYQIRIISSIPAVTSTLSGAFTIYTPVASISPTTAQSLNTHLTGYNFQVQGNPLMVTETPAASSRIWYAQGPVTTNAVGTGTSYTPDFSAPGTYTVYCVSSFCPGVTVTTNSVTITVTTPTITTNSPSGTTYCVQPLGSSPSGVNISVPFTFTGIYSGNTFSVQLSDASGSFNTPTTLSPSGSSSPITATIPAGTTPGTRYLVRVVSGINPVTGSAASTALTVSDAAYISGAPSVTQGVVCEFTNTDLTITGSGSGTLTYTWYNGTTMIANGSVYSGQGSGNLLLTSPPSADSGLYYVILSSSACPTTVTSNSTKVVINPRPLRPYFNYDPSGAMVPPFCGGGNNLNFTLTSLNAATPVVTFGWQTDSLVNASVVDSGGGATYPNAVISVGGGSVTLAALAIYPSGCSTQADTTFVNNPASGAAADTGRIIWDGTSYICLNNTVSSYQWGYDDANLMPQLFPAADADYIDGQNLHLNSTGVSDLKTGRVWCITGSQDKCLYKTYYNDPAPGPIPVIDSSIATPVRVFPNPVSGQALVQWHFSSINDKVQLVITDMQGRRVLSLVPAGSSPGLATIDVSSLPNGVYIVAVYQNNRITAVGKLVKIRQ